jgi:hypothetical protein
MNARLAFTFSETSSSGKNGETQHQQYRRFKRSFCLSLLCSSLFHLGQGGEGLILFSVCDDEPLHSHGHTPPSPPHPRTHALPQVQGVWFRRYTVEKAQALGLVGWCMNTESGTVKGEAEGPPEKLEVFRCVGFWGGGGGGKGGWKEGWLYGL